ncbi:hypothetical protein ACSTI6_23845, partial [Vibrio parahaemolyticus]
MHVFLFSNQKIKAMKNILIIAALLIVSSGPAAAQDTTRHINYGTRDDRDPNEEYPGHSVHQGIADTDTPANHPMP